MWLFRTDPKQKVARMSLIRHCQLMFAYQQYAAEVYNKGAIAASEAPVDAPSGFQRQAADFASPELVAKYVVPALVRKVEIIRSMMEKHQDAIDLAVGDLWKPYDEFAQAIDMMLHRGTMQLAGFEEWVRDQSVDTDVTQLDASEMRAIVRSAEALNRLIKKAGVTSAEWLEIYGEAFNEVRAVAGLPPLSHETFSDWYLRGLAGESVWFFD